MLFDSNGTGNVGLMSSLQALNLDLVVRDGHLPETSTRVWAILWHLRSIGILSRCKHYPDEYGVMKSKWRQYCDESLLAVHSENHVNLIKYIQFYTLTNEIVVELDSRYFNQESSQSAFFAAASAIKAAHKVAQGKIDSAFAIVRPPGHLAERNKAKGFCLYNNVAVAATHLLNKTELGIRKILIVDWDINHGSGTQNIFWKDSRVLFFSVHRYDGFRLFGDGYYYTKIGEGAGLGYTINVPWLHKNQSNADYFAVWDHILLPVAKEFNPDIIIVSAGFNQDAYNQYKDGHLTPYGYSVLLEKLKNFADGRIVMVLEGGYNLHLIAEIDACFHILLGDRCDVSLVNYYPFDSTWYIIQQVRRVLSPYWPILASEIPQELLSQVTHCQQSYIVVRF